MHAVLVEEAVDITRELYAAVLDDPASKGPLLLFSRRGGMDIEEVHAASPSRCAPGRRHPDGLASSRLPGCWPRPICLRPTPPGWLAALVQLYGVYLDVDASLVEVNPLVLTSGGEVVALDAKVTIDDASVARQPDRLGGAARGMAAESGTDLERRGRELGLTYIELDGDVGVLANGAGLTMTTLDAVHHLAAGRPTSSRSAAMLTRWPHRPSSWCWPTPRSPVCWSTSAAPSRGPT